MKLICFLLLMLISILTVTIRADTIKLVNGRTIHGKALSGIEAAKYKIPSGYTRIQFKNNGWLLIRTGQVASIEIDDLDDFDKK